MQRKPHLAELLQRKVEERAVVRLKDKLAAGHEEFLVASEKTVVREAALRMTRLGPRIAEVHKETIDFPRRKNFLKLGDVEDEQAHILQLLLAHLLRRRDEHILLLLDADEIDLRGALRHLTDEIALARAKFDEERRLASEDLLPTSPFRLARRAILRIDKIIVCVNGLIHPRLPAQSHRTSSLHFFQLKLLQIAIQRDAADIEKIRQAADVAARRLPCTQEYFPIRLPVIIGLDVAHEIDVLGRNCHALRMEERLLQDALHLLDVARPIVRFKKRQRLRQKPLPLHAVLLG